jgi:hypothetical protein
LRVDVNALMPIASNAQGVVTATAPNPTSASSTPKATATIASDHDQMTDDYRLTGSYRLDLTRRNKWLGLRFRRAAQPHEQLQRDDELRCATSRRSAMRLPLDLTSSNNRCAPRLHRFLEPGSALARDSTTTSSIRSTAATA